MRAEKQPGFANASQTTDGFGHAYVGCRSHADPCISTREACRCQGSLGNDPGGRTAKRATAFKILLESYPCHTCDKMRSGRTRFPDGSRTHESHDNDSTKAATGRRDP